MKHIAASVLPSVLTYDALSGTLTWLHRPNARGCWNARFAGKAAITSDSGHGYRVGSVLGYKVYAHRVAWAIHYGAYPDVIDHINGDRADNRISNLRDVSAVINSRNSSLNANNTSGVNGVSRHALTGKWVAMITIDRKAKYLGLFDDLDAATAARMDEQARHGFHPNHGRQA